MDMNAVKNFRENIVRECNERGITQADLATKAGIHPVNVNRIFRAKSIPALDTCDRIASALGLPLEALISDHAKIPA